MIGIYKITSPSGKIYIGQSVNIANRLSKYKNANCKTQRVLYNSIIKYGWKAHKFEVLCECDIIELNDKERYYQDLFNVVSDLIPDKLGIIKPLSTKKDIDNFLKNF